MNERIDNDRVKAVVRAAEQFERATWGRALSEAETKLRVAVNDLTHKDLAECGVEVGE